MRLLQRLDQIRLELRQFCSSKSSNNVQSTIFALSSGYGKCGVAVVRVSGPDAREALKRIGGFKIIPEPRKALLRKLKNPVNSEVIDHGLTLWFPGPSSFTGEDTCEFQIHGGPAVIEGLLRSLSRIRNFRPAEPGEFTKRAFFAGKLNLTEVEGLGDLINSDTEIQRKQALIQMEGALGTLYSSWRNTLTECVVNIEAFIDFGEDQHLQHDILEQTNKKATSLIESISKHLGDGRKGERIRDGVRTVILGEPNVGKSSLLNFLTQSNTAIVSPIPGTTRDVIKTTIDVCGFPIIIADTAGLRNDTSDFIEEEGISRAKKLAAQADLILFVVDAAQCLLLSKLPLTDFNKGFIEFLKNKISSLGLGEIMQLDDGEYALLLEETEKNKCTASRKFVIVLNKIDLISDSEDISTMFQPFKDSVTCLSCKTGEGMDSFISLLGRTLQFLCGDPSREHPNFSQARHRHHLDECLHSLNKYMQYSEYEVDLAAHELRNAINSLGKITGHVSVEQILDVIFKTFCIGK